jgi:hypothetical protein
VCVTGETNRDFDTAELAATIRVEAAPFWPDEGLQVVEPSCSAVAAVPCSIRQVRWSLLPVDCSRCGGPARASDVTCVAIDIDLEQPVVPAVEVSVHR